MRERKKKLAEEKTELVAYVDASRRCVTDAMGQKVGFCLLPKVLSYQPKILLHFLFERIFSHFLDLLFHFHPLLYAMPCEIVHCCFKLRTLSPVKNLRGDILKHRTRMKDEALEEGDFLVSADQVLSLA